MSLESVCFFFSFFFSCRDAELGSFDDENEEGGYEDEEAAEEDLIEAIAAGTASLEQLLDSDLFVNSLSDRSQEMVDFLKVDNHTEKLIELVVSPETLNQAPANGEPQEIPAEIQVQRRQAYVAYQALTTEVLCEILIEDYTLLDRLFSFLDHPSQNDALKNGYFSKIVLTIYERFPAELFLYFSIKAHMVAKFCQNIKNLFVMELLFKFIDSLSSHQWLADEHLIGQLVDLLDEEKCDMETQESAVRTLEIICNICSYCPYSVLVTQILETESVTTKLLTYTLAPGPTRDFRVRQGLGIVIQVLNLLHKDTDSFEFEELGAEESEEKEDREPPYFVTQFTERLPEFVEVLRAKSDLPGHKNAGVTIASPFGFTRLRVLEFVVGLIGTGFPMVVARLDELDVFTCCVDIFFDNPWNNFAHHQVYLLLSRVFATGSDFATVEKVLTKSGFLKRMLEAFEKNDSRSAGYFGHAVELCNEVLNCAAMSAEIASLLDNYEGWNDFVEQKLEPINAVSNSGPNAFGDEEEEEEEDDFSYDPEQYYFGMGNLPPGEEYEEEGGEEEEGVLANMQQILDVDQAIDDDEMLNQEIENDLRNLSLDDEDEPETPVVPDPDDDELFG